MRANAPIAILAAALWLAAAATPEGGEKPATTEASEVAKPPAPRPGPEEPGGADSFVPSERIGAESSVPFPADI